jgi:hypothetical protein
MTNLSRQSARDVTGRPGHAPEEAVANALVASVTVK